MAATTVSTPSIFGFDFIFLTIFLAIAIIALAGNWRVFVKMGEKGWKSIIPFFNEYVIFKRVWNTKAFWAVIATSVAAGLCSGIAQIAFETNANAITYVAGTLSLILLFVSLVLQIRFCNKVAKSFGKGIGMTLALAVIPFFAILFLGFGQAQYKESR